jgi:hypothetical protein
LLLLCLLFPWGVLVSMPSLKEVYDRFVAQPNADDLHADASLTYISSGTKVAGANEIVKYLFAARSDVKVTENVLACHIGHASVTVEVAAECAFKNGPSWIAPGVEANLLDGMIVKIALVYTHV